jgi:phosphoglycerate dehydrogenase-like enzyme
MRVLVDLGAFGEFLLNGLRRAAPYDEFVTEGDADVMVTVPRAGRDLTGAIPKGVRWVHNLGAGVDGVPLDTTRITTCSRGASSVAIAEFVLATMLAFEKDLPGSWINRPPPGWNAASLGGLAGKQLGLVGVGAIGGEVATRALAFDMRVVALRRSATPPPPPVQAKTSLSALLAESDHVVVAAPATPQTHHMFDRDAFAAMKPGAHFVNISRGALVDQDALLDALDNGPVAMASLDAVEPEPLPDGHPFYTHPKVRLSPHISWSSPQTARRTVELFVDNLRRYRDGEPLTGVVDTDAGY